MARYFKCIKAWQSERFPELRSGELGMIYELQEPDGIYRSPLWSEDSPYYIKLIGLEEDEIFIKSGLRGYLNSERFVEVFPSEGADIFYEIID